MVYSSSFKLDLLKQYETNFMDSYYWSFLCNNVSKHKPNKTDDKVFHEACNLTYDLKVSFRLLKVLRKFPN